MTTNLVKSIHKLYLLSLVVYIEKSDVINCMCVLSLRKRGGSISSLLCTIVSVPVREGTSHYVCERVCMCVHACVYVCMDMCVPHARLVIFYTFLSNRL